MQNKINDDPVFGKDWYEPELKKEVENEWHDSFLSVQWDQNENIGLYSDISGDMFFMSITMAKYIIKKVKKAKNDINEIYSIIGRLQDLKIKNKSYFISDINKYNEINK